MENSVNLKYENIKDLLKGKCGEFTIQLVLTEVAKIEYQSTYMPTPKSYEHETTIRLIQQHIDKAHNYIAAQEKLLEISLQLLKDNEKVDKEKIELFNNEIDMLKEQIKRYQNFIELLEADALYDKYCLKAEDFK